MNGYTIFLGPFAGIMITDVRVLFWDGTICRLITDVRQFWLVHKGKVDVPAMYDPNGRYRYTGGFVSSASFFSHVVVCLTCPKELACRARDARHCGTDVTGSHEFHQPSHQYRKCESFI